MNIPRPASSYECLDRYCRANFLQLRHPHLVEGISPDLYEDDCDYPRRYGHLHIHHDSLGTPLASVSPIAWGRRHVEALFGLCRIWYGRNGRELGI